VESGDGRPGRLKNQENNYFSDLMIILTGLSEIWNFWDDSSSKNPNFLRLLDRLTALADVELPVKVMNV
jgi:hypothetical protein